MRYTHNFFCVRKRQLAIARIITCRVNSVTKFPTNQTIFLHLMVRLECLLIVIQFSAAFSTSVTNQGDFLTMFLRLFLNLFYDIMGWKIKIYRVFINPGNECRWGRSDELFAYAEPHNVRVSIIFEKHILEVFSFCHEKSRKPRRTVL